MFTFRHLTPHATRHLGTLLILAGLASCASPPPRQPLKLTILHTNDHHGRFWTNGDGEYGMAARKTLIDRIRAEVKASGGQVLLLDGGDVNTGVPESDLQDAEPDFKGMNAIGYDAMAVGNHEFDKSPAVLAKQRTWTTFPMLAANIYGADGKRLFEPYKVFGLAGWRIAVMGLTTDDTRKMALPDNIAGIEFRAPAAEAAMLMPELRAKADMVIATTHMGHYPGGNRGVNAPGDVEMARAVKGFDLIVGGHSQNPVCMAAENVRNEAYIPGTPCAPDRQNGAWIVQAHEWGKYVGRADFELDAGQIKLVSYALLPVNLKQRQADGSKKTYTEPIPEDAGLRAMLAPYQSVGQDRLGLEVAQADGVLDGDRERVRRQATNLGLLVAMSMLDKTGADVALMNAGGVRDSLPAGRISYRDVLKVQPFGNTVVTVQMSGAELLSYLQTAAKMTPGSGAFAHVAGARLVVQSNVLVEATVAGKPIDTARSYRLAVNNFTASGGDGYPKLSNLPGYVNTGFVDAEVLRAYLAAKSPIKVADFDPAGTVVRR